jgi:hypothetical protein
MVAIIATAKQKGCRQKGNKKMFSHEVVIGDDKKTLLAGRVTKGMYICARKKGLSLPLLHHYFYSL